MVVIDASALLALLLRENGAAVVRQALRDNRGSAFVHAANMCEVFQRIIREWDLPTAQRALQVLARAGLLVRDDMDPGLWQDAGEIIARVRLAGHYLALGDSLGVALARRLGAEFLTGDRHDFDPTLPLALCSVRFIR